MAHDVDAPKQRVTMTLNGDLVRQARDVTSNLSETVETLLAAFLADAEARETERQRRIDAHVVASDAFIAKFGSLAEEFDTL